MKREMIIWNDKINFDFISMFLNSLNNLNDDDELILYLSSSGGFVPAEEIFLNAINQTKVKVTINVSGAIYSSAFSLFFLANCEKEVLRGTIGMFHSATVNIDINHHGNPAYFEGVAYKKMLQSDDKEHAKNICDYLEIDTLKIKKIMKGEDVYFSTDEMIKMLEIDKKKRSSL